MGLRRYWYQSEFPAFKTIFENDWLFLKNLNFTTLIRQHEAAGVGRESKAAF